MISPAGCFAIRGSIAKEDFPCFNKLHPFGRARNRTSGTAGTLRVDKDEIASLHVGRNLEVLGAIADLGIGGDALVKIFLRSRAEPGEVGRGHEVRLVKMHIDDIRRSPDS